MSKSANAYKQLLKLLLPPGRAITRERDTEVDKLLGAMSQELARLDSRGDVLINEMLPPTTNELLPDWERALALPDQCVHVEQTVDQRRAAVNIKLGGASNQSAQFFIDMAAQLGFLITVTEYRKFAAGNALVLDGSDSVSIAHASSLAVGNVFSIGGWFKATALATRQALFSTRNADSAGSWEVEVGAGSGDNRTISVSGTGSGFFWEGKVDAIEAGTWTHFFYVRNGGAQTMYLNGAPATASATAALPIINNTQVRRIGAGTGGTVRRFTGSLDRFQLFNRAITAAEVLKSFQSKPVTSGAVGYWDFENNLTDSSGAANNGTAVGSIGYEARAANADWAHTWRVNAPPTTYKHFRAGRSVAGERIRTWGNEQLECTISGAKPAHSVLLFSYGA